MMVCRNLQKNTGLDMEMLRERDSSLLKTYVIDYLRAIKNKSSSIMPIHRDVAGSSRIVLACPVMLGNPAPAILGFIRGYELEGKELCCILTYGKKLGDAEKILRAEIEKAGGKVVSCLSVQTTPEFIEKIKRGRIRVNIALNGELSLKGSKE